METKIRLAKLDDLDNINLLFQEVINDLHNIKKINMWNSNYPFCEFLENIKKQEMYVLEKNGVLIGSFTLTDFDDPDYHVINWTSNGKKWFYMNRLVISPMEQNKGFASMIMDFIDYVAITNNYEVIRLTVHEQNFYAMNLYIKFGFKKIESSRWIIGEKVFLGFEKNIDVLENITSSCKFVSENSKNVSINYEKIDELIEDILNVKMNHFLISNPHGIMDLKTKDIINLLLLVESIDFSFFGNPKWTIESENGLLDGYSALLYTLFTLFQKVGGDSIFPYLEHMSIEECRDIFKGNVELPLLEKRCEILKEVSSIVNKEMNGDFYECIKNFSIDSELFDFILFHFKNFSDKRVYLGKNIYFYKLAQLLTSNLLCVMEFKEQKVVDSSHLVGCADYKIPQIMRNLGVLSYTEVLANTIDSKIEIKENDPFEVEIRANMLMVIQYIYEKTNKKWNRININNYFWLKSQEKNAKNFPYHLTRTTNY